MLDKFKEKKDDVLRQDLRDRLYTTLHDSSIRLRNLEDRNDEVESKIVMKQEVEEIIEKRFEQFGNGLTLTDVRNKMLNLKVKAQPNQKGFNNGEMKQVTEMESLKLEMVKEMKRMREDLKSALDSNQECITELQKLQSKKRKDAEQESEQL